MSESRQTVYSVSYYLPRYVSQISLDQKM